MTPERLVEIRRTMAVADKIIDGPTMASELLAEVGRLRSVLETIRSAPRNEDSTAKWMQRLAAWALDARWLRPDLIPPLRVERRPVLYPLCRGNPAPYVACSNCGHDGCGPGVRWETDDATI